MGDTMSKTNILFYVLSKWAKNWLYGYLFIIHPQNMVWTNLIIIIFIYCNWVVTRWQWLFYMYIKISMTPSGIEPANFRFVAQHLSHCATAVPLVIFRANLNLPIRLAPYVAEIPRGHQCTADQLLIRYSAFIRYLKRNLEHYRHYLNYRYATHNDVSVKDGPHIRRWSHKIMTL